MQVLADWLLADNRSASLITLYTWTRTEPLARRGFGCVQADAVVVLDLTRGPEALLKDFSANRRINVKKAIRAGVEVVQTSDEDDFARYYEIHRGWCQHKGVKVQPFEQVLALLRLTDNRRLFLARVDGRPIAGIVVRFVPGGLVEYAACGWYKDALELRPNDLLHWRAIEWACASGYRAYSLAGSHLFLRKFGGEVKPTYRYRIDRTFLRRHEVNAAAVAHVRAVFHRLPSLVQMSVRRLLPKAVVMDGLTSLLAG
jgi:hypothetical protein